MNTVPSQYVDFIERLTVHSEFISAGSVKFLDHKDREVVQSAVLIHHKIYNQMWAWTIDNKGKISNMHPMYYTEEPS